MYKSGIVINYNSRVFLLDSALVRLSHLLNNTYNMFVTHLTAIIRAELYFYKYIINHTYKLNNKYLS